MIFLKFLGYFLLLCIPYILGLFAGSAFENGSSDAQAGGCVLVFMAMIINIAFAILLTNI